MRTRLVAGAALAVTAALLASAASAAPTVSVTGVRVTGGSATVRGTAAFDDVPGAVSVGGTPETASPAPPEVFAAAGVDLVGATIAPLGDGSGLRFTWRLSSLAATPPPEVVRYTWSFAVGEKTFQLQAKRSNAASSTANDDPVGHAATLVGTAFQLRGNCTATYAGTPAPVASCPHLAFLQGAFDPATATVSMDLPFGQTYDEEVVPGAVLTEFQAAGMSIGAGFQAAVSTTSTTTYINGWDSYHVGRTVEVGTGTADAGPDGWSPALLSPSGSFTGTTPVGAGADTAFARSCVATTCSEPVPAHLG